MYVPSFHINLNAKFYVAVFIQVQAEGEQALFSSQVPTIVALTKGCKSATVVRDPSQIPAGCASAVVTPTVIIHTLVRVSKFRSHLKCLFI
jgi:valyl-tRNA synthetase